MKFIKLLNDLKAECGENYLVRKNGTVLLNPGTLPKYRHMLFAPLSDEIIEVYLLQEYKNVFPKKYIEFLKYSNGANLYAVKIKTRKVEFAHLMLSVFGLPLTPPFGRPLDMEEPYDLRIEDLSRHESIPNSWLKCGTYIKDYNFKVQVDIFIDTQTQKVFAVEKNKYSIVDKWENLDECLCEIYTELMGGKLEYNY